MQKYNRKLIVEIEVWVTHRSEIAPWSFMPETKNKEWRASVKHSNESIEWQWCKTYDEAVEWCELPTTKVVSF